MTNTWNTVLMLVLLQFPESQAGGETVTMCIVCIVHFTRHQRQLLKYDIHVLVVVVQRNRILFVRLKIDAFAYDVHTHLFFGMFACAMFTSDYHPSEYSACVCVCVFVAHYHSLWWRAHELEVQYERASAFSWEQFPNAIWKCSHARCTVPMSIRIRPNPSKHVVINRIRNSEQTYTQFIMKQYKRIYRHVRCLWSRSAKEHSDEDGQIRSETRSWRRNY